MRALVAAVVVAAALLSSCTGPGETGRPARPVTADPVTADVDDAVCPKRLPRASASTHGFGTFESATSSPGLGPIDAAWVCAYRPVEVGEGSQSGGGGFEWLLSAGPTPVPTSRVGRLERLLAAVTPAPGTRACTSDLGPRYALVYARGVDRIGVVVDDFGCHEVRLSDDLFTTVPGEGTRAGTVPGVLMAPPALLRTLKVLTVQTD